MDKSEIQKLLCQIKIFYPRFDAVEKTDGQFKIPNPITESWFGRLGFMEYDRAIEILDNYLADENGARVPTIALWIRNGKKESKAWHSARLDQRNGLIIWRPEGGPEFELKANFNVQQGCWEDEDGRLWATAGE